MPQRRIRLHPIQAEFRRSDAVYRGLVGGIGSGKSWAGAYDLICRAKKGRMYAVVAPTYPMLRDASLRTFLAIARDLNRLQSFNKSEMVVTLGGDTDVLFRSADNPDRLRGPNLSGCWLDEASLMHRDTLDVMVGRLRECGEQGWLSATFTPKGRTHWTYEFFACGAPDVEFFRAPTAANPFLHDDFVPRLRQVYPGPLGEQELGGEFIDVEGAEWPSSYFPDSMWFDDFPSDMTVKAIGVDPSKGSDSKHGDYSATVLMGRCNQGKLWCEALMFRQNAEELVATVLEAQSWFQAHAIAVETNMFASLLATQLAGEARRQGMPLPIVPVVNTVPKPVRIRRLGPYLAQKVMRFRATTGTKLMVQQMREFGCVGPGLHDDGPDAAEVALRTLIDLHNGKKKQSRPTRISVAGL